MVKLTTRGVKIMRKALIGLSAVITLTTGGIVGCVAQKPQTQQNIGTDNVKVDRVNTEGNAFGHNEIFSTGQYYEINKAVNPYLKQESNDVRTAIYYNTVDGNKVPRAVVVMAWNWTGKVSEEKNNGYGDDGCWATPNGTGLDKQQLMQVQNALERETGLKLEPGLNYITNHFNGHDDQELRLVFNVVNG
jgi:hypothetical protein